MDPAVGNFFLLLGFVSRVSGISVSFFLVTFCVLVGFDMWIGRQGLSRRWAVCHEWIKWMVLSGICWWGSAVRDGMGSRLLVSCVRVVGRWHGVLGFVLDLGWDGRW